MQWKDLKARLLAVGQAHLTGEPADKYIARSTAGPGAGGSGAVFFAMGSHRVKLALNPLSSIEIAHRGNGSADLFFEGQRISGHLLEPGFHCPDQAFITVTGSCIFSCKYCSVPHIGGKRKTLQEILEMVESVRDRVHAISITSGVLLSIEEEEAYVLDVVKHLIFVQFANRCVHIPDRNNSRPPEGTWRRRGKIQSRSCNPGNFFRDVPWSGLWAALAGTGSICADFLGKTVSFPMLS